MIARRYLAIVPEGPGRAAATAAGVASRCGLSIAYESARLCVLTEDPAHCIAFDGGEGAFVGTLFTKGSAPTRVTTISPASARAILASDGQAALTSYWGGYVLFCDAAHSGTVTVSRDPSGAMPCYTVETGSLRIFASDLRTLIAAGFVTPAVDVPVLLRHMLYPDLCLDRTCIEGVGDLLPGMRLQVQGTIAETVLWWSPWTFACDPIAGPVRDLSHRLRDTVDGCVAAWASCSAHILLALSGGVDSSIVAAALHNANARFSGLNMVDDDPDGDERFYARQVARALGIPLAEAPYDPTLVDLRMPSAGHLPRPVGTAHVQAFEVAARRGIDAHGFDAWFNGMGGDNVFCWMRSSLPVADAVLSGRPPRALRQTVGDVASLADVSALAVLRQTARLLLRGRRPVRARTVDRFLTPKARGLAAPFRVPPWFAAPGGARPGRAHHVEMITRLQTMVEGLDRWTAPPTVVPLLSQPVLELCLRIASWDWVAGGRNRAVARDAYAGRLPEAVIERRSKGGPDKMSIAVCLENLPLLREMLLDGFLAQHGLLDRESLDRVLNAEAFLKHSNHGDILQLADTEAWIRHWQSRGGEA